MFEKFRDMQAQGIRGGGASSIRPSKNLLLLCFQKKITVLSKKDYFAFKAEFALVWHKRTFCKAVAKFLSLFLLTFLHVWLCLSIFSSFSLDISFYLLVSLTLFVHLSLSLSLSLSSIFYLLCEKLSLYGCNKLYTRLKRYVIHWVYWLLNVKPPLYLQPTTAA